MANRESPILLLCMPNQLREQVRICHNSEYEVTEHRDLGQVSIKDGRKPVFSAYTCSGVCFVKAFPRYYRHPFAKASEATNKRRERR